MMISSNPRVPGAPIGATLPAGRRVAFLLAPALVLLALGCPGSRMSPEREVHVEVVPRKAVVTAGRDLPLGFVVAGTANRAVTWKVEEANGGTVSPAGLYSAPAKAGVYHVQVRSLEKPSAMDRTEIAVHAAPQAVNLTAEPARIRPGATVTLTPVFQGGRGVLLPGNTPLTSGTAVSVTPVRDATYLLRVTNDLGVVDEKSAQVHVEHIQRVLHDINGPEVVRVGSHHVAWVERRVGARLRWSSDDVTFLGDQPNPATPVVVFTPRSDRSTFRLQVQAEGGTDLAPEGQPVTATYELRGVVEPLTGDDPIIKFDRPFLTAGKAGCQARVEPANPGTTYTWRIENGAFATPDPTGAAVTFSAGQADHLLLTCTATRTATGTSKTTTAGVVLLQPPSPPALNASGDTVAGLRHWAYVKTVHPLESYRWELDPAQGALDQDADSVVGPLASFKIRQPGPFTLRCRAENPAGEVSEWTALTLTAVGPFSLQAPEIHWPQFIRENSGPHALAVAAPPPGLTYRWEITGGTPASAEGPQVTFQAGAGPSLVITCTARDTATGSTSSASKGYLLLQAPARPAPQGPGQAPAGSTQVAGLTHGARPGERYEWTLAGGDLQPPGPEDRGAVAVFTPRMLGPYTLTVVAVNDAGDRSEPAVFTGTVTDPSFQPGPGSAPLELAYDSGVFPAGARIPDQAPRIGRAVGPVTYRVVGSLAPGLTFDPATGVIGGTPSTPGPALFRVAATAANGSALSSTIAFLVNGAGSGPAPGDPALAVSYDSIRTPAGTPMADLRPALRNAHGPVTFAPSWGVLPPNVDLDPATGTLSGNPSTPGTYLFQLTATEGSRSAVSNVIGMVVADPAGGGAPGPAGTLAMAYDTGHFQVGIRIPDQRPRLQNAAGTPVFTVASGQLPPGLALDSATGAITGTPSVPTSRLFRIAVSDGTRTAVSNQIGYLVRDSSTTGGALAISYDAEDFTAMLAIPDQRPFVHNAAGPLTFRVSFGSLPANLRLDPATGVISGTPDQPGPSVFRVTASDGVQTALSPVVAYVVNGITALALAYDNNPPGFRTREQIPEQNPTVTDATPGTPTTFQWSGQLPPGLALDPVTGVIKGRPTQVGSFSFTVTAQNWTRTASANLTYAIALGPQLTVGYPDLHLDLNDAGIQASAKVENGLLPNFEYSLVPPSRLPAGLDLDRATGDIAGQATELGRFPFRVRLRTFDPSDPDPAHEESVDSAEAVCQIDPAVPLAITDLSSDHDGTLGVLDPGQSATLSWAYQGLPKALRLTRNLLPDPPNGTVPDAQHNPLLSTTKGSPGTQPGLTVSRRQTFTLTLTPKQPGPALARPLTLATRGMEAVAGNPRYQFPSLEYRDGARDVARLPEITGLAYYQGDLLVSEGSYDTIRRYRAGTGRWERFRGVPRGPDQGAAHVPNLRLNRPGPLAILGDTLLVGDTGSRTIKQMHLNDPDDLAVLAGRAGDPGPDALHIDGHRLHDARFGTIMDLKVQGRRVYIADQDYGIRILDLDTSQVATLRHGAGGYRTEQRTRSENHNPGPWPALAGPIALAVNAAEDRIFVLTQNAPPYPPPAPGAPPKPNFTIQQLFRRDFTDSHGVTTHWRLSRFAGLDNGYADGYTPVISGNNCLVGAKFKRPVGLQMVGDDLLVVDRDASTLRCIDLAAGRARDPLTGLDELVGRVTTLAGAPPTTPNTGHTDHASNALEAKFKQPSQLVQGENANEFWVVDQAGLAIRKIERNRPPAAAGQPPATRVTTFLAPNKVAPAPTTPADRPGLTETQVAATALGVGVAGPGTDVCPPFNNPLGVVVERATGDAFVVGPGNQTVRRIPLRGTNRIAATRVFRFAGMEGQKGIVNTTLAATATKFSDPTEIGIDGRGRQYVLETSGSRLRLIQRVGPQVMASLLTPGHNWASALPLRRLAGDDPAPHLAVRPGGADPQFVALSHRPRVLAPPPPPAAGAAPAPASPPAPGAPRSDGSDGPAGTEMPWRLDVLAVTPAAPAGNLNLAFEEVVLQFDHPATTQPAPRALAFGLDSRLYALFEDPARQVCELHTYVRQDLPAPARWVRAGAPVEFGPGLAGVCERWAFPRIHAMAANSRGDLFLTDSANAVVWLRRADTGEVVRLAGNPAIRQLLGEGAAQPFDTPLYRPTGIAVTGDDDVVILDGNAVIQLTAPGVPGYGWRPPVP